MRIRIWNAFASNNSGSYTIVGRFPTTELASEVAGELLAVAKEQSSWRNSDGAEPSPLVAYAARYGIPNVKIYDDEWPDYSSMDHPAIWAIGHQVFLHESYTVTISPVIGHLMYARGGRVEVELDHSHHPIAATFEIYFPRKTRSEMDVPARVQDIVDALCSEGGVFSIALKVPAPAWRGALSGGEKFGEPDLIVGAAFEDLQTGFTRVAEVCAAAGAPVTVRIAESPSEGDPFAHLRPERPKPRPRDAASI